MSSAQEGRIAGKVAWPQRIGFIGGMPPSLGGGGLEIQMAHTANALRKLGHEVFNLHLSEEAEPVDVLHAFGCDPAVWTYLRNRTRSLAPLVLTPTLVIQDGKRARLLPYLARAPLHLPTIASMMRDCMTAASVVGVVSRFEGDLSTRLGAASDRIRLIPNGSDAREFPTAPVVESDLVDVLLVGTVCPRKRQAEVLKELKGTGLSIRVLGALLNTVDEAAWRRLVGETAAVWSGEIGNRGELIHAHRAARVFVLMSSAEAQSLALVDALALGMVCVVSDHPSHREFAGRYPQNVHIAASIAEMRDLVLQHVRGTVSSRPDIPTWGDVARQYSDAYVAAHG